LGDRDGVGPDRKFSTFSNENEGLMNNAPKMLVQNMWDVTVVDLQEPRLLEVQQIDAVGKELFKLVDQMHRQKLILDCSKVQFLASAAIGMLVTLQKKVTAIKGTLIICGLKKDLMRVFEITALTKLFKFAPDEKEALKVFGYSAAG
jgi:anti-anti-sigma factor